MMSDDVPGVRFVRRFFFLLTNLAPGKIVKQIITRTGEPVK